MDLDRISAGDTVVTADGETIGTIGAIHDSYLLVEKGVLLLANYHIPWTAVDRYDAADAIVYLTKTSADVHTSGWEQPADEAETGAVPTLLTGAATTPDTGEVLAVLEPDDEPLRAEEAEID